MPKKNVIYIVLLCVGFAITLVLFILSFFLGRIFGVAEPEDFAQYEATVSAIERSQDALTLSLEGAVPWSDEEVEEAAELAEEAVPVACKLIVPLENIMEGAEEKLAAGVRIRFLAQDGIAEGGEYGAAAVKLVGETEDEHIATLDLYNKEKTAQVNYTRIGLLCVVVALFVVGGFSMMKLSGVGPKRFRS